MRSILPPTPIAPLDDLPPFAAYRARWGSPVWAVVDEPPRYM